MRVRTTNALTVAAVVTASLVAGTALAGCGGTPDADRGKDAKNITLTITANSISGGKNAAGADWIEKVVIPKFVQAQRTKGVTAKVTFRPSGVEDEQYKTKLALDLKSRAGADVISLDGIWLGEFADAGYVQPLSELPGGEARDWDGWKQIPDTLQALAEFDGKRYGIPEGSDGRVLFYNKTLFARAGLPTTWQPESWQEILDAGTRLKALPGVTPIQLNAGTAMGEATTMQGVLPFLAGTGTEVYADGKWTGGGQAMKDVLGLYQTVYSTGLGDPKLQQEAQGRDKSFAEFAAGKIGILAESDYFWRGVLDPREGVAPMKDRDTAVGYALIPAKEPGRGLRDQDFVSMSGGADWVLNPNTKFPHQAFELLTFMFSPAILKQKFENQPPQITCREDVNAEILTSDPMLSYIADKVLPVTAFRPARAVYPQVSVALQEATAAVVSGKSPDEAAEAYQKDLEGLVGGAKNVAS
jgi:multiple sugar transport system substrate-binding protein